MKKLYLLPFDHRKSFMKIIKASPPLTKKDIQKAKAYKKIIYRAFLKSLKEVPKKHAAILVDEQFGREILKDAKKRKITICNAFEKSGPGEFQFERKDWKKQLREIKPDYAKILIRYNPEEDKKLNLRQAKKLSQFGSYLKKQKTKFLLEIMTPGQKPKTILKAVKELQKKGVAPDVWKLEGLGSKKLMQQVANQVKSVNPKAAIIILGGGEKKQKIEQWLKTGAQIKAVIGFAVGRTIFEKPLKDYRAGKISRKEAINKIAQNYSHFVKVFEKARPLK